MAHMQKYAYFCIRPLKRSTYKNRFFFSCGTLKEPYGKMEVDFYRRDQLRSAYNLKRFSYRKIVSVVSDICLQSYLRAHDICHNQIEYALAV